MSPRTRNRRIAVALVLGGLILPLPAAASPERAVERWEQVWNGLFAWLGFGSEDGRLLLTGWSSSSIDPNGGQLPNAVTSTEGTDTSSYIDPNGRD